jgi:hypothetical protein
MGSSNGKKVENDKKASPQDSPYQDRRGLGKRELYRAVPINKSEDEDKKQEEEKEPIKSPASPQVTEPHKKVREKSAQSVILSLELADLKGFLLLNLGMNLLLLNKDSMTIETDGFLIGCPCIEPKGGASTHGTAV